MSQNNRSIFCISLDFEKYWGIHDVESIEDSIKELKKVKNIVLNTLALFERYEIHATWAIVGLLLDETPIDSYAYKKKLPYLNKSYSPFPFKPQLRKADYNEVLTGREESTDILKTNGQELASHTFSHLYANEEGISSAEFIEDIDEMRYLSGPINHSFKSIVFPRNQVNKLFLKELKQADYNAFRGNQPNELWQNSTFENESKLKRGKRWIDAYFGKSKTKFFQLNELEKIEGLLNIPASRFLRPNSGRAYLEKRKVRKIKSEMEEAAKNGSIYHLWWHPHNFSKDPEFSLAQLEEILQAYQALKTTFGMKSLNMSEIADHAG